ncbi:MAG: hypothetical protein ACYDAQ_06890 [Mycobacteriales bacterium]
MARKLLVPDERSRLLLDVYGHQVIKVSRATGGGPGDSPYVVVRSPHTLAYCLDANAVSAHTYAWLLAHAAAAALRLPPEVTAPPGGAGGAELVASVTHCGAPAVHVAALAALASPTGVAHVAVRTGEVTVRCYDQAGLRAHVEAWVAAHGAAGITFRPGPERSIAELHREALGDARSPYACLRNLGRIRDLGAEGRLAAR